MNIERTIKICGKDVLIRYCTATETGYESISGKSSVVFIPKIDVKGNIVSHSEATVSDYINLGLAGIVAAYTKQGKDSPITANDILYEATPDEVTTLITTITEMRGEWYNVPAVIQKDETEHTDNEQSETPKN